MAEDFSLESLVSNPWDWTVLILSCRILPKALWEVAEMLTYHFHHVFSHLEIPDDLRRIKVPNKDFRELFEPVVHQHVQYSFGKHVSKNAAIL